MVEISLVVIILDPLYYFLFCKERTTGNISQLSYKTLKNGVYSENCNPTTKPASSNCGGDAGVLGRAGNEFDMFIRISMSI